MAASLYPPSLLDADQIIQHVYDDPTQTLRTSGVAVITPPPGGLEVAINHIDDSIAIGTSTDLFTSTTIGGDIGLDVNIINPSIAVTIGGLTTPNIQNITIAVANVEQSYVLPVNTKTYNLKARGNSRIRLAYTAGQSGTNFVTIPPGNEYNVDGLNSSLTIYFQANNALEVIELESWS